MHASDICSSWIDEVLHEAGVLDPTATVTDAEAARILDVSRQAAHV